MVKQTTVVKAIMHQKASHTPCITSIVVAGLAKDNQGCPQTLTVPRIVPDHIPGLKRYYTDSAQEGDAVAPIADTGSTQSPDARGITLRLEIGDLLHSSYVSDEQKSWVYDVKILSPCPDIPPLVAKVSNRTHGRSIMNEASAYDALRELQGVILPRCYGYFRCFLDLQAITIIPWDPECEFPRDETTFDIFDWPNPRASFNILLIEKLGRTLGEVEIRYKDIPVLRDTLTEMLLATARLGVMHGDVHRGNIAEVPDGVEPGPYKWRIIDWEMQYDPPDTEKKCRMRILDDLDWVLHHQ
ncbi:hypothetical protein C8Q77DRAFT_1122271 [Trametes polyzona]|nr:hypothetical protein C8Q77DRAFT_1122271 [Trametes polyzona]